MPPCAYAVRSALWTRSVPSRHMNGRTDKVDVALRLYGSFFCRHGLRATSQHSRMPEIATRHHIFAPHHRPALSAEKHFASANIGLLLRGHFLYLHLLAANRAPPPLFPVYALQTWYLPLSFSTRFYAFPWRVALAPHCLGRRTVCRVASPLRYPYSGGSYLVCCMVRFIVGSAVRRMGRRRGRAVFRHLPRRAALLHAQH